MPTTMVKTNAPRNLDTDFMRTVWENTPPSGCSLIHGLMRYDRKSAQSLTVGICSIGQASWHALKDSLLDVEHSTICLPHFGSIVRARINSQPIHATGTIR